jgi:orotate phosphoribosyltransferase
MEIRSDSTALITGAASGFGAAVARRLTAAGARVVLADVDEPGGRAVAEEVGGLFVRCDVRRPQDLVRAVAAGEQEYGRLNIAFLNAGVASREGKLEQIPVEEYQRVVEINLGGVYFGAQAALPALRRAGGGAIVATASLAGLMPMGIDPLYTLTKHAVVGLVRSLAEQFRDEGIDVVVGPTTGGVILAFELARPLGVDAAYAERASGESTMREFRRGTTFPSGARVLVVDDILTTGGSVRETLRALAAQPVEIVGVAILVDRSAGQTDVGAPLHALATLEIDSWDAASCPLCRRGEPLTKPGTTPKP